MNYWILRNAQNTIIIIWEESEKVDAHVYV